MKKIHICPIKRLYQLLPAGDNSIAIISSAAPVDTAKLGEIPYVFRQYEDIDYPCKGRAFSREDAAAFVRFVKEWNSATTFYCCCDAGESRSPAVAAALCRYFEMDDAPIWQNPHYHPNMLVFTMLMEAFNLPISDEEIDFLLYTNQKAFRDAISGS